MCIGSIIMTPHHCIYNLNHRTPDLERILGFLGSKDQIEKNSAKRRRKYNSFRIKYNIQGWYLLGKLLYLKEIFGNMASETSNLKKIFDRFISSYIIINLMIKHGNFAKYFLPTQIFSGNQDPRIQNYFHVWSLATDYY